MEPITDEQLDKLLDRVKGILTDDPENTTELNEGRWLLSALLELQHYRKSVPNTYKIADYFPKDTDTPKAQ